MKNYLLFFVLVSAFLLSCSEQKSIADIEGEIIWQEGDKSIKNVIDSIPKVVISGLKRNNRYTLEHSFIEETESSLIFSGSVKILGDLNNDGVPEFLHEDLIETADTLFGWRMVVSIFEKSTIQTPTGTEVGASKGKCQGIIGSNENYSFDGMEEGGPYLVLTGSYGYVVDGDCNNYQQANTKDYYTLSPGQSWVAQSFNCAIANEGVNLSNFYKLDASKLRFLPLSSGNYYDVYGLSNKLIACGSDNNDGLSHLEKVAGVKAIGSAKKRDDLMPFIEEEFKNINPEMIKWINENLIPKPDQTQANGLPYEFIYKYGYKDQFRKIAILKALIAQQGQEAQMREYAETTSTIDYIESEERTVTKENFYTISFLEQKMYQMQELFNQAGFESKNLKINDYGFLLRRMLDGSEPEIWNLTRSILKQYDNDWYTKIFVDKKWTGIIEIDSATYYNHRLISGADSIILGKEAIPEGIAIENGAGITISCKNGKEVTLTNNNGSDVSESYAEYKLKGYWPQKETVLVEYQGWEHFSTVLVDLNNPSMVYRNSELYPSQEGIHLAELIEDIEYKAIQLYKLEGSEWVKYKEYSGHSLTDGFWIDSIFYFKESNKFYTIGELVF